MAKQDKQKYSKTNLPQGSPQSNVSNVQDTEFGQELNSVNADQATNKQANKKYKK